MPLLYAPLRKSSVPETYAFLHLRLFIYFYFVTEIALLDLFRHRLELYLLFIHNNKGCIQNKFKVISKLLHTQSGSPWIPYTNLFYAIKDTDNAFFSPPQEWSTTIFRTAFQPSNTYSSNIDTHMEAMTTLYPLSGQQ